MAEEKMAFTNFTLEIDGDGIALVSWDMPGRAMNVFDESSIGELEQIVTATTQDGAVKGVVLTSGKEAFCAGADLAMLERMNQAYREVAREQGEAAATALLFEHCQRLSQLGRRIETCGKPWVAAINGMALGGGFELTLCCHYRVAAENPKARLGLPEVKVGLLPGGGGTQRIPRLVSPQDAMTILLKGDMLSLDKAKALRLIHAVVAAADLVGAAKAWIKGGGSAVAPWDDRNFKLPGGPVFSKASMMLFPAGNAIYRRETYDNYPAARAIMSCVYEGLLLPIDAGLRMESRYFTHVLRTKEAAAMIRTLFLSLQELNKGARRPAGVAPTELKRIAIIGAGFMGASIGYVSARAGLDVVLIDRDQDSADKGKAQALGIIEGRIAKGRARPAERDALAARIEASADYAAIKGCDLVIEAVFEDRKVKAETFARAAPHLGPGTIFASNTSTLPISSLAESFCDPERFIGIHFFSPVEKMLLVEVIRGRNTGEAALASAIDYIRMIGKTPIVVSDSRGFFANRCVMRYVAEGVEMFLDGVPPAMVENSARMAGMPVGPLSLSDEVALDLSLKIMRATEADLGPEAVNQDMKGLMVELVENQGRLGRKNAMGFYDYPPRGKGPKSLWPGLKALQRRQLEGDAIDVGELKQRFLVVQAVEAARTVAEGVITDPREADVGSILGFGFAPFTGGALSYIDFMGVSEFLKVCRALEEKFGARFTPPPLLEEMAARGETFYSRFAGA